jgi:hypothetical protein
MRKSLWIVPVLLLCAAIVAPDARADDIVDINVSNITFPAQSDTENFSASFEYDNTTESVVLPSMTTTATGPLGAFTFLIVDSYNSPVVTDFIWQDATGDQISVFLPFDPPIPLGTVSASYASDTEFLFCQSSTCEEDIFGPSGVNSEFPSTTGPITVSAVSEPGTLGLTLIGFGLLVAMRKRIAEGLPQAT